MGSRVSEIVRGITVLHVDPSDHGGLNRVGDDGVRGLLAASGPTSGRQRGRA